MRRATSRQPALVSGLRLLAASIVLVLLNGPLSADEFKTPSISAVHVEWRAALDQLKSEIGARPALADRFAFSGRRTLPPSDPRSMPAFVQLNAITSRLFTGINRSPVPVLLPFDAAAFLSDRVNGIPDNVSISNYQVGFQAAEMFAAGPSGYDAVFSLAPGDGSPDRVYTKPVQVQITGSVLVYDLDDPFTNKGKPARALAGQFPDLRRVIREGFVRYAFTRFGVPYVVSIECVDSTPQPDRLACREASGVAERFLKALRVSGGEPSQRRTNITPDTVMRPVARSPEFAYRPPGDIIANSGYRGQSGHPDYTVYSQIRFPLEQAPAFANSQSFLNWGDCFHRGRVPPPEHKGDSYHCKSNDKPLVFDESAGENYAYPWQDNFCEARDVSVGQCPSGFGHPGQDIRPSSCQPRDDSADRCEPNRFAVVAVRDGVLIRSPKQQAATLLVDTRTEHIRFRYLQMTPDRMDAGGVLTGRRVEEGEKIGLVSDDTDDPAGTTSHLHFGVQVFTREGWLWVNPYVTLISAYEHLIGARGRELSRSPVASPAPPETTLDREPESTPPKDD